MFFLLYFTCRTFLMDRMHLKKLINPFAEQHPLGWAHGLHLPMSNVFVHRPLFYSGSSRFKHSVHEHF